MIILVVALVVSALVRAFLVQAFYIPSGSMENTLLVNDRVIVSKIGQTLRRPDRGDIVVFRDPGGWLPEQRRERHRGRRAPRTARLEVVGLAPSAADQDVIKRVIGVGGDRVVCCDCARRPDHRQRRAARREAVPLPRRRSRRPSSFDVTVPRAGCGCMGDHRSDSGDSRVHLDRPGAGHHPRSTTSSAAPCSLVWPFSRGRRCRVPSTFENPALVNSDAGRRPAPAATP